MNENRSKRNKTIDFALPEGAVAAPDDRSEPFSRVICGDCLEALKRLPQKSYRLLIADPPYNMDKDFGGHEFKRMTDEEYAAFTESWLSLALPLLTDDASVYVCCDWCCSSVVEGVLKKHLKLRNRITWQREKGRGALMNWKNSSEDIWFATVSDSYVFNADSVRQRRRVVAPYRQDGAPKDWQESGDGRFRDTAPSNFWNDITVPYWSMAENTAHPTQKSEKLMAKLILASSEPGDAVLDPFAGSGSAEVAAKKLGRRFTGIEVEPLYCAWAEKRLADAALGGDIQGYADGVFWDRNTRSEQDKAKRGKK